jgi:phosphoglucosamine mutase
MGKYFGTDGFRGEANVTLTVDHAFKVGRFLGWFYGKNHENGKSKVVIGKDTRRSSYMFEYALVAGLTASGADVYLLHVTTTPSVSYVARTEDFDCGIMISASHNPFYDNGIKLINDKGEKMREDVISQIEKYLDGDLGEIPYATKENIGRTVDYVAGRNRYMGYLMSLAIHSFKDKRIGLDAANGSAWTLAKAVFDALGAKTYVINANPDGTNINTNCGSTHIEGLQELVRREHLDAGFAFDGDADRCLCVDENGEVITGDHILYIYGCYMKEQGALEGNKVVTTVMSNFGLYKAFDAVGIEYEKTAALSDSQTAYYDSILKRLLFTHFALSLVYDSDKKRGMERAKEFYGFLKTEKPEMAKYVVKEIPFARMAYISNFNTGINENLNRDKGYAVAAAGKMKKIVKKLKTI